jgi:hypothetical protein
MEQGGVCTSTTSQSMFNGRLTAPSFSVAPTLQFRFHDPTCVDQFGSSPSTWPIRWTRPFRCDGDGA